MIIVTVWRDSSGMIRRFKASGHAGYAPSGSDIICSAITAIASTAIGSLQDIAGMSPETALIDGLIECRVNEASLSDEQIRTAKVILESMVLGCRQIERSYGRTFVQVREKTIH